MGVTTRAARRKSAAKQVGSVNTRTKTAKPKPGKRNSAKPKSAKPESDLAPEEEKYQAKVEDADPSDCDDEPQPVPPPCDRLSTYGNYTFDSPEYERFSADMIPSFEDPEQPPVGFTYSNKYLFARDKLNNTVAILEKTGIEVDIEAAIAAGYTGPIYEQVPSQPLWFPQYVYDIIGGDEYPGSLSFMCLNHLTKFRRILAGEERRRWKFFMRWGKDRMYHQHRLEHYTKSKAPAVLVKNCERKYKEYERKAYIAMHDLDIVVQAQKYFDPIMAEVFKAERDEFEDWLPATM